MNQQLVNVLLAVVVLAVYLAVPNLAGGEITNELSEEDESGPDGGLLGKSIGDLFGTDDVLDDGVSNLVDSRSATCSKVKNEAACKICCDQTNKAYKYAIRPGLKINWALCTCFERVTPRK